MPGGRGRVGRRAGAVTALGVAALVFDCRAAPSSDPPDPSASPQAKAEPAPIASPPTLTNPGNAPSPAGSSSGAPFVPPPTPMRPDEPLALEPPPREPLHEPGAKEGAGVNVKEGAKEPPKEPPVYALAFVMHASDLPGPPKGVELSQAGLDAARRKAEPSFAVDVTPGHARATLHEGFVLPEGTELRARTDRYGYVVVAPDGDTYRIGATGSLRAILGEGLFDVAPSSAAEVAPRGEGGRRFGRPTRHVEVTTRAARGAFELAKVPDAGDGGVLLCRMFLDLMSAGPSVAACADGEVPLHVELRWSGQPPQPPGGRGRVSGSVAFEAVSFTRKVDAAPSAFLTPPPAARFVGAGEPAKGAHLFLSRSDLAALHAFPGDTPPAAPGGPEAPSALLSLHNSGDELRYVWLDGVPLAWLAPGGRLDVSGVPHARATVQWRTFLGDVIDAPQSVSLPAVSDSAGASGPGPGSAETATSSANAPP